MYLEAQRVGSEPIIVAKTIAKEISLNNMCC
jgi:hypothetical protein